MSEIDPKKALLMLMTSLITSQRDVKVGWLQEMDTELAYQQKASTCNPIDFQTSQTSI